MKNILYAISLLVLSTALLPSCNKEDESNHHLPLNDYLPLKVGAIYKYKYSYSYTYVFDNSNSTGECTWKFISVSEGTPLVYQVERSLTGYNIHEYYSPPRKDTTHFENLISTLRFEVQNDGKVDLILDNHKATLERFIQSDRNDTCFREFRNGVCLRKNVGITSIFFNSFGNHSESEGYYLIEGPTY
jgi:hypothetical protein